MIKMKKLASMLCAVAMAVSVSPIAPIHAADTDDGILLQADYETKKKTVLEIDYEGTVPDFDKFEGGHVPTNEIKIDGTNHYGRIDAYHSPTYGSADWFNGGYTFEDSITSGTWTVSFRFNVQNFNGRSYSNISLANKADVKSKPYGQFRLISYTDSAITVNNTALTGDLTPTAGSWYNYKMTLNKTTNQYSVEISDNDGKKATGSGTISQTLAFDGLMFGAAIETYIDDIKIEGDYVNAPEFVALDSTKPTHTVADGYATIEGSYNFGGYKFKKAMTSGNYEVKFDFNITKLDKSGGIHFTDASHGGSNQPCEWQILNTNASAGKLAVGGCAPYAGGAAEGVTLTGLSYETGKWYSYHMIVNKTNGEYTVTVTERGNASNTGTATGNDFPEKAIDHMMIGWTSKISIDNILIQEYHDVPKIVSAKFVDSVGNAAYKPDPNTTAMKIEFSEPMDKDSLDSGVIFNGANTPTVGTRTLSDDKKTYTITFTNTFAEGDNFRTIFSDSVKSTYNKNMSETIKVYTANPTGVLLDVDYDITTAEYIGLPDSNGSNITVTDDGYATISESDTFGGYKLKNTLGSGKYTIDFDFNINKLDSWGGLYLLDQKPGSGRYTDFQLMHVQDGSLYAGGYYSTGSYTCENSVLLSGLSFETGKWYSYHMEVSGSHYEATVTERGNTSNKGTAIGDNFPTMGINYLELGWQANYSIDNILIAKVSVFEVEKVEFLDKNGVSTVADNDNVGMLTDRIVITMTEAVDTTTVDDAAYIYDTTNDSALEGFTVSASGKTITFSNLNLTAGNQYTVGVAEGLKSSATGKVLDEEYGKEFTTGADVQKIDSIKFSNDGTKVIVNAQNSKADYDVTLILAYYKDDELLKVNPVTVTIEKGECGDFEANATVETISGATEVKAMLWSSLTACEALVPSIAK